LRALLWDVDGTIAETERDGHRVAFNAAFADAGLPWRWGEARYGELLRVTGGRERLLADMQSQPDAPGSEPERAALARALHQAKNAHYASLVAKGSLAARPGVLPLMKAARAAGVKQAIVTTTSRANVAALMAELLGAGWCAYFEACVCGEDVSLKKPHPEAYLIALDQLACPPHASMAIEDSPAGVQAAAAASVPVLLRPSAYFESQGAGAGETWRVEDDADFTWASLAQRFASHAG
jgi:HAD superfamily hydrolase (TIGR01509 family)